MLFRSRETDDNATHRRVIVPHHDTTIATGDHVVVFVPNKRMVREVERLFQVSAMFMF